MQASVDAGDEYAPFFLGTMYMSGHIDDEDAGYNGMRFLAIAANRGAECVEKEIAENRLNFAKCYSPSNIISCALQQRPSSSNIANIINFL